jgi:hypothetical protein
MRVRANKTIRYNGVTYLKGDIFEPAEKDLERILKGDKTSSLIEDAQQEKGKVIIKKLPISYMELLELSHKELDELDESLEIESKGTIAERATGIWEFLSQGSKVEEDEKL